MVQFSIVLVYLKNKSMLREYIFNNNKGNQNDLRIFNCYCLDLNVDKTIIRQINEIDKYAY